MAGQNTIKNVEVLYTFDTASMSRCNFLGLVLNYNFRLIVHHTHKLCYNITMHAGVTLARGIGDKVVNLSVTCNKKVAHLNWNTGGLSVKSIRLAQQCVAQDKHNESTLTSEV